MISKHYLTLSIRSILSLWLIVLSLYAVAGTRYCNSRYGFCVNYPSNFGSEPAPDNNDGQVFFDRDGFRMTASGSNNVTDETVKSDMNGLLSEFDTVTYRKLGKNWFALSGYKDDSIIYIKGWVGAGSINHLYLQYPSALKTDYDNVVKQIVKSFRPGDLNNSHSP